MQARKLTLAAMSAALVLAALPAASTASPTPSGDVCNEAENSWQGGYEVTGDPVDPNPPAFLRGEQMRLGNGHGAGLVHAAEVSPALRLCGPMVVDGGGDGGGAIT